ncbi:MAG: SDR family oxidoreductase, partial [Anaerolineae bacterium]
VDALRTPQSFGRILEIGGADVLTYGDMMLGYARVRGLRRYLIPVPVLTPSLSSYWVHWVTPIPADIARPLIEGLRNEVIVRDGTARRLFPHIEPVDYLTAVRRALASLNAGEVETAWSDALVNSCGDITPLVLETREGMIIEQRRLLVQTTPEAAYYAFTSLGGERGWLYADWAWHLRGAVDRLIGGVGLRRGRRHPYEVRPGDALDFWRVEAVEPGRLLRLRAEMKLPGDAWLQYEALPQSDGRTLLMQTAFFAPKGLLGFLYWYGLLPAHRLIFTGLLRSVARLAQEYAQQSTHNHRNHRQTSQ